MTRLTLLDPHAQAASRITDRGYIILPALTLSHQTDIVIEALRHAERLEEITDSTDARRIGRFAPHPDAPSYPVTLPCPFPAAGEVFFVGEAWKDWALSGAGEPWRIEYRGGGVRDLARCPDLDHISSPNRWQPARHMPEWAARTRFRVLSRSALRLGDVTEEMASGMGFEPRGTPGFWGTPHRNGVRPTVALETWWPLWTRTAYNTRSWAFVAHVERI